MLPDKQIFIIAGCNGAGKTTAAKTMLPELQCFHFVNADNIAAELSPSNPESKAIEAGKIMLNQLDVLANRGVNFAFETTLSGVTYANRINKYKNIGYKINIIFFWLSSVELAIDRVQCRVKHGGHNIFVEVIKRRYPKSIYNFLTTYKELANDWFLFDNSFKEIPTLIAKKFEPQKIMVYDYAVWDEINLKVNKWQIF